MPFALQTQGSPSITEAARERLRQPYARRLVPQPEGGYTATVHEFPGCFAEGDTADEALASLESAAVAWVSAALESGRAVPDALDLGQFSGKVALRLSRTVHRMASERAALEGVSLNQLLATAIATYLGQLDGLSSATLAVRQVCSEFVQFTKLIDTQPAQSLIYWPPHSSFVSSNTLSHTRQLVPMGTHNG